MTLDQLVLLVILIVLLYFYIQKRTTIINLDEYELFSSVKDVNTDTFHTRIMEKSYFTPIQNILTLDVMTKIRPNDILQFKSKNRLYQITGQTFNFKNSDFSCEKILHALMEYDDYGQSVIYTLKRNNRTIYTHVIQKLEFVIINAGNITSTVDVKGNKVLVSYGFTNPDKQYFYQPIPYYVPYFPNPITGGKATNKETAIQIFTTR